MTKQDWLICVGLLIVASFTHFIGLSKPAEVVFDEVHFGKFVSAYCCTHERFFDIHPPHAKLLIAGAVALTSYTGSFTFDHIGQVFTADVPVFAFRFVPALSGVLLPLVIYWLLRQAKVSRWAAVFGAGVIVFDNAITVQTRLIALDGILLLAQFGALAFFLAGQRESRTRLSYTYFIIAGALCGLAVGTKFTGLTALAMLLGILGIEGLRQYLRNWQSIVIKTLILVVSAVAIYVGGWWLHYYLLTLPGSGDVWQLPTGSFWTDMVEIQQKMLSANYNLTATHPYSSPWWTWPFMGRPVFYWQDMGGYLYFIGNPVVWWGSFVGLVLLCVSLLPVLMRKKGSALFAGDMWIYALGYIIALLPLVRVPRALFLYHYLTPLIFSIILTVLYIDGLSKPWPAHRQRRLWLTLSVLVLAGFVAFSPYTFGFPISETWHTALYWFPKWR